MNVQKSYKTRDTVYIGMFTAVLAVLSQISIPLPSGVPITLQTFGVALCGAVLGWKLATLSVLVYVFAGAIGVPVFSGMQGGAAILFGTTGGFIWGFVIMAALCGLAMKVKSKILGGIIGIIGLVITHLFGIIGFSLITNTNFMQAFVLVSLPYLIKDILSVIGGLCVATIIRKYLAASNIVPAL